MYQKKYFWNCKKLQKVPSRWDTTRVCVGKASLSSWWPRQTNPLTNCVKEWGGRSRVVSFDPSSDVRVLSLKSQANTKLTFLQILPNSNIAWYWCASASCFLQGIYLSMASKNFKFSCLYGRPCRAETRFGSTLAKDFSIPVDCQRQKPACKHALKAKISSEGTKKAGRLERQLVKKKAVTHLRAGGSFMDYQCLSFCC